MTKLIIRWTEYVSEGTDEETGEIVTPSHYDEHYEVINLEDVLKIETHWGKVTVLKIDGTKMVANDDECEVYFR